MPGPVPLPMILPCVQPSASISQNKVNRINTHVQLGHSDGHQSKKETSFLYLQTSYLDEQAFNCMAKFSLLTRLLNNISFCIPKYWKFNFLTYKVLKNKETG